MKKFLTAIILFSLIALTGCQSKNEADKTVITSTSTPTREVMKETTENDDLPGSEIGPTMEVTLAIKKLPNVSVGDYVTFGTYEQDYNTENGPEPIEWLVLDKEEGKALVLSKYCLDLVAYHYDEWEEFTWETCSLRKWLNVDFFETAFGIEEQAAIVEVAVDNSYVSKNGVKGGNNTFDKVFLLSVDEARTYFDPDIEAYDSARQTKVTKNVVFTKKGIKYYQSTGEPVNNSYWWLRSPGYWGSYAAAVTNDGWIYILGQNSEITSGVRPALWITCDSEDAQNNAQVFESPEIFDIGDDLSRISEGDYITFGEYEQDNNSENGSEAIEWQVLDKKDGKVLLLSKYALDYKAYDEEVNTHRTWYACTLREWLNNVFYRDAFDDKEKAAIIETENSGQHPTYEGMKILAKDNVFLLSIDEVTTYFNSDANKYDATRRSQVTEYAKKKSKWGWCRHSEESELYGCCCWWLRSTLEDYTVAPYVASSGYVKSNGGNVKSGLYYAVRPAIWIDYTVLEINDEPWFDIKDNILVKYTGEASEVIIPSNVVSIGDYAFEECRDLKRISIPSNVISIGECAFENCTSLIEISIPSSVVSIGEYAFNNCSSLIEVNLSDGIIELNAGAFSECSSLKQITIPGSVVSIGDEAFSACDSLSLIDICQGVTSIGESAFSDCSELMEISIPNSIVSIGKNAFSGCSGLMEISIPNSVRSVNAYAFEECESLTTVNIPSSINEVSEGLFSKCNSLVSISIPSSITTIGAFAFCDCDSLTEISIPNSVRSIGEGAFCDCDNLKEICIPSSVTVISDDTFSLCSGLKAINIPSSVTSISERAFDCIPDGLAFGVEKGTFAEQYAIDKGYLYYYTK